MTEQKWMRDGARVHCKGGATVLLDCRTYEKATVDASPSGYAIDRLIADANRYHELAPPAAALADAVRAHRDGCSPSTFASVRREHQRCLDALDAYDAAQPQEPAIDHERTGINAELGQAAREMATLAERVADLCDIFTKKGGK